jgi:hypothetical protein
MYIHRPLHKSLKFLVGLALVAGLVYGALWLDQRDSRRNEFESYARTNVQTLAETSAAEAYPSLRTARTRYLSGGGIADGHAAGQRADLGRGGQVTGRARRRLG